MYMYIYVCVCMYVASKRRITPQYIIYNSKPLGVVLSILRQLSAFVKNVLIKRYIYIYNDTYNVLIGLRNTAYWIVVNKTLNETAKGNVKNTFYWIKVFLYCFRCFI